MDARLAEEDNSSVDEAHARMACKVMKMKHGRDIPLVAAAKNASKECMKCHANLACNFSSALASAERSISYMHLRGT